MKKILLSVTLLAIGLAGGWFLQPLVSGQPPAFAANQSENQTANQAGQPPVQAGNQGQRASQTGRQVAGQPPQGGRRGMTTSGEAVANEGLTVEAINAVPSLHQPEIAVLVSTDYQTRRAVSSKSEGDVIEVLVALGETVQAGDVLVQIENLALERQRQSQLLAIEQQLATAQLAQLNHQVNLATLADAKQTLAREQSLAERSLGTDAALNNAESALRSAQLTVDRFANEAKQRQAQLSQARLALADIEERLASLTVVAPIDGVVSSLDVAVGDQVGANNTIVTVASGTLYRGVIPQAYGEQLTLQSSELSIDGQFATLSLRATQAVQGTLEVEFISAQTANRIGQQQLAYIALPAIESIALPISSLYQLDHVFEVRRERLQQVPAEVMGYQQRNKQLWALVNLPSLPEGGQILTTTLSNASDGTQVKVRQ